MLYVLYVYKIESLKRRRSPVDSYSEDEIASLSLLCVSNTLRNINMLIYIYALSEVTYS